MSVHHFYPRVGEPTTVEVSDRQGSPRLVRAFITATPGLVVHESLGDPGWCVTHERSGLLVTFLDDPEGAQACAAFLGQIDWTRSGADLRADVEAIPLVREAEALFDIYPIRDVSNPVREERFAR